MSLMKSIPSPPVRQEAWEVHLLPVAVTGTRSHRMQVVPQVSPLFPSPTFAMKIKVAHRNSVWPSCNIIICPWFQCTVVCAVPVYYGTLIAMNVRAR